MAMPVCQRLGIIAGIRQEWSRESKTRKRAFVMATIESYLTPRQLYRYRSLDNLAREIEAIEEGYLYCAAYQDLNDPMEGLFASSRLLKRSKNHQAIRAEIIDRKNQLGICSFSEIYDHELMWAHYADQFKGICVAYNLSRLLEGLGEGVSFVRMYYNEKLPTVLRTNKRPSQLAKMVLSCKNYRWLHEREWRMFASLGRVHYSRTECVTRVYLGSRMESNTRRRVMDTLKRLKIPTNEMTINEYSINFECPPRARLGL